MNHLLFGRSRVFLVIAVALSLGILSYATYGFVGRPSAAADSQQAVILAREFAYRGAEVRDGSPDLAKRLGALAVGIHADEITRSALLNTIFPDLGEEFLADGQSDAVDMSADGGTGLTAGSKNVTVWRIDRKSDRRDKSYEDFSMLKKIGELKGHASRVDALALSGDGRLALTGSDDGESRLWNLSDPARPKQLAVLSGRRSGGSGSGRDVLHVELAGDGNLAVIAAADGRLAVWRLFDRARPREVSTVSLPGALHAMALSADGRTLVTVSGLSRRRETHVWDLSKPSGPQRLAMVGGSDVFVESVSLNAGGTVLLAGQPHGYRVWDLADRAHPGLEADVPVPISDVASVSLSADGSTGLVSGYRSSSQYSMLGHLSVWDLRERSHPVQIAGLFNESSVGAQAATSADGAVALTSFDAGASIWDFRDLASIKTDPKKYVCSLVNDGYRLSRDEWNRYGDPKAWDEQATRRNGDSVEIC
ncbi:WD40 repeat domain-containing protein [Nonomuraea sp. NPDC049646]|uniref:WD40 repeat domain-containing protein n=1 Tax=unclassified Nonomuraea TaxID=2593643 RepID=UPI0037950E3F